MKTNSGSIKLNYYLTYKSLFYFLGNIVQLIMEVNRDNATNLCDFCNFIRVIFFKDDLILSSS